MKQLRNKTNLPMRVPLPGGKVLHLGPRMTAQVSDAAAEHRGVKKLIEIGSIELFDESAREQRTSESTGPGPAQAGGKSSFRRGSGDR